MTKFQTETTVNALKDIILSKFDKFLEEKRNTPTITKEIKKEIEKIETIEDMLSNLPIEQYIDNNNSVSIYLGGYSFYYNRQKEIFEVEGESAKSTATWRIYNHHNLNGINWREQDRLINRITGIVSLLDEAAFEDIRVIVESQLDFEEFMPKNIVSNYLIDADADYDV